LPHIRTYRLLEHDMRLPLTCLALLSLAGCGVGESAATAALHAEQAKQLQQQTRELQQQIDHANLESAERLQQALNDAE
jgi:type IV pilus biogenesis protein CpaD/CtpE